MRLQLISLTCLFVMLAPVVSAQQPTCKSLHTGSFKVFTKETGTTYINRTKKEQIERNDDLGYEVIFDIKWINDCTYELRPKKLLKGDPAIMGDGTNVLKTRMKDISTKGYVAETSSNFDTLVIDIKVEIVRSEEKGI